MASRNGDASNNNNSVAPVGVHRQLSQKEIADVFGHVPWMEFNVTAKPNLKTFSTHPAIRQIVSQVAQSTVKDITDKVTANVMNAIKDAVDKAISDATSDVPHHVMSNMDEAFRGITIAPNVTPLTAFQRLNSPGTTIITNDNIDDSVNIIGNNTNIDSGNINNNSGNTYDNNNNNNPNIIVPSPDPTPIPEPEPNPPQAISNPDLSAGQWIWTQEQPYNQPPGGARAFRKTVTIPDGYVDSMVIDITCDNFYTLYINGCVVGNGTDWNIAQRYSVKFDRTNKVVIAVYGAQDPIFLQQAGLIAASVLWDSSSFQGRTYNINTDGSWKTSNTTDNGFQKMILKGDNSKGGWTDARVEGKYGMLPWGNVPKPTTTNPIAGGFSGLTQIPDPPSAPQAKPGPDTNGNTSL